MVTSSAIVINECQKGNPVIDLLNKVSWHYSASIVPDYEVGNTTSVLFLSLKFHKLHPKYIYERIRALGKQYKLRIILVLVDLKNPELTLRELTRVSVPLDVCVIVSWGVEEAARYLETFKMFETRSASSIREKPAANDIQQVQSILTSIPKINKTDALNLVMAFDSFKDVVCAQEEELRGLPGFGEAKVQNFLAAMNDPFIGDPLLAGSKRAKSRTERGKGRKRGKGKESAEDASSTEFEL